MPNVAIYNLDAGPAEVSYTPNAGCKSVAFHALVAILQMRIVTGEVAAYFTLNIGKPIAIDGPFLNTTFFFNSAANPANVEILEVNNIV